MLLKGISLEPPNGSNTRVITAGFSVKGRIMLFDNNIDNFSAILHKQRKTPAKALLYLPTLKSRRSFSFLSNSLSSLAI